MLRKNYKGNLLLFLKNINHERQLLPLNSNLNNSFKYIKYIIIRKYLLVHCIIYQEKSNKIDEKRWCQG